MSERLSASEIDALLTAVHQPNVGTNGARKLYLHDWKEPRFFDKEAVRVLAMMAEIFSREFERALSGQLGQALRLVVASVDEMRWEAFIRSVPDPSVLATHTLDPLPGMAIFHADPVVTSALVQAMMGAACPQEIRQRAAVKQREATQIEQNLLELVIVQALASVRFAWVGIGDLRPRLSALETSPRLVELVGPHDSVLVSTMLFKLGEVEGYFHHVLPWLSLASEEERLTLASWHSRQGTGSRAPDGTESGADMKSRLAALPVEIWGELPLGSDSKTGRLAYNDVATLHLPDEIKAPNTFYTTRK